MARDFGFLTENWFWTWRGHVINTIVSDLQKPDTNAFLNLEPVERIMYFKYYLEADGAALLLLAEKLLQTGCLSWSDFVKTPIVEQLFLEIWQEYLDMTSDLRERITIRKHLSALARKGYDEDTRPHKVAPRLGAFTDFGLIEHRLVDTEKIFAPLQTEAGSPLAALVTELKNIRTMEEQFDREEYFAVVAKVFDLGHRQYDTTVEQLLGQEILRAYAATRDQVVNLAPIKAITDIVTARLLAEHDILIGQSIITQYLDNLSSHHPYDVRFHVDRQGRRAYLVISDNLMGKWQ
jgi:hypothetical protein